MISTLTIPLYFASSFTVDTEIPILPQSPSPPPQQRSSLAGGQSQQTASLLASTLQPSQQHRPLLHGLLSGTHLPQGPYHRGYSTSSTVCPTAPFPYGTPFELDDDGFLENIFHLRSMEKLKSSHHQAFLKLATAAQSRRCNGFSLVLGKTLYAAQWEVVANVPRVPTVPIGRGLDANQD
uniref:Uncharacterized protein n=1 Tax=Anopheles coluzzii TaxID=1518534 RepID=A0A8W7P5H4_ANOCL